MLRYCKSTGVHSTKSTAPRIMLLKVRYLAMLLHAPCLIEWAIERTPMLQSRAVAPFGIPTPQSGITSASASLHLLTKTVHRRPYVPPCQMWPSGHPPVNVLRGSPVSVHECGRRPVALLTSAAYLQYPWVQEQALEAVCASTIAFPSFSE